MKRLLKYLLGATAVLILAAVAVLYAVPEWLKQREIRAAEADLALLAAPPAIPHKRRCRTRRFDAPFRRSAQIQP